MTSKLKYTAQQYNEAPAWVKYELVMLLNAASQEQRAARKLSCSRNVRQREYWRADRTCALEAFLVHYRNLKQFLNNEKYETDVKAIDYVPTWTGHDNVPLTYGRNEGERINQLLAHISYTRGDLDRGQWDLQTMERHLLDAFEKFLDVAPNSTDFDEMRLLMRDRRGKTPTVAVAGAESNSTTTVRVIPHWW